MNTTEQTACIDCQEETKILMETKPKLVLDVATTNKLAQYKQYGHCCAEDRKILQAKTLLEKQETYKGMWINFTTIIAYGKLCQYRGILVEATPISNEPRAMYVCFNSLTFRYEPDYYGHEPSTITMPSSMAWYVLHQGDLVEVEI